jgi:type IV pilus assembly protein PilZ
MVDNKRESPRIATNIEIKFREKGSFLRSYMLNVNNGGLFLKTEKPLPIDAEVTMQIQLPDDKEVMAVEGRVVWTNAKSKAFPVGMGIQFTKITPEHQEKVKAFVSANLKEIKSLSVL